MAYVSSAKRESYIVEAGADVIDLLNGVRIVVGAEVQETHHRSLLILNVAGALALVHERLEVQENVLQNIWRKIRLEHIFVFVRNKCSTGI